MKRLYILLFSLLVIGMYQETCGTDLRGGFAVSAMGGLSGQACCFMDPFDIEHAYGFGVRAEYFFLKRLSGGVELVHNCFQGTWQRTAYEWPRELYYSSDWNWTSLSVFGRFTAGPEMKLSPYVKAGVGLYIPRAKDWAFYAPDTVYTHTSYGKGQFGYHFGLGIQYRLVSRVRVFFENSLNFLYTKGLVIHWVDLDRRLEWDHSTGKRAHYVNLFAGVSLLLGKADR